MDIDIVRLVLACCATAHLIVAMVLALYARYKVQYLSIAWIMGIFAFVNMGLVWRADYLVDHQPGMLHPMLLLGATATSFLQSIYPLSFTMPGYLQMGRMWRYASPAIVLIILYSLLMAFGGKLVIIENVGQLRSHLLTGDLLLRVAAMFLVVYYIVNIFRLPHKLSPKAEVPGYLYGYITMLGISAIFYAFIAWKYNALLMVIYLVMFTLLNLYLTFRTLETMAISLPKPVIEEIDEEPAPEVVEKAEREDFNEANLQRFHRVEYWMQNHTEEWTDNTFGRDRLCEQVGYNRHLLLQSVRSQGYNNVHDYINSYRIAELKRRIQRREVNTVSESLDVGFGTAKTARSCFLRMEGVSLDDYLARRARA